MKGKREGESSGINQSHKSSSWNKNKSLWFLKPNVKRKQSEGKKKLYGCSQWDSFFLNDLVINIDY